MKLFCFWILLLITSALRGQEAGDSLPVTDTALRIINFTPYFTQNIDSVFVGQFDINKDQKNYYWYLNSAPIGLTIGKNNGILRFTAAKNYFLSGKMKYDFPYAVKIGVQSLVNPKEKIDTFFSILFYNTEIVPSKLKPSMSGTVYVSEGETVSFTLQCETGNFPFETILFNSNVPLTDYTTPNVCGDKFIWTPAFDFVKETDSAKIKMVVLSFIGSTRFRVRDTAVVRLAVRDALNYPLTKENFDLLYKNALTYILQLKYSFLQLDRKLRKVKGIRLGFDLTSASTALTGTILNTSSDSKAQRTGKILPSIGLALTPIKEAAAGNKPVEQNQAAMIRNSIKRLEYMLQDNQLVGEKDADIIRKTQKLKDEVKQVQVQMIDIPVEITTDLSEEELNNYFNSPKVNKKYRLKHK